MWLNPVRLLYKLLRFCWAGADIYSFCTQDKPCIWVLLIVKTATYQSGVAASFFNLSLSSMHGASLWTHTPCDQVTLRLPQAQDSKHGAHLNAMLVFSNSSFYSPTFYYFPVIEQWKFIEIMLPSNCRVWDRIHKTSAFTEFSLSIELARVFSKILQKSPNELFGQPNIP